MSQLCYLCRSPAMRDLCRLDLQRSVTTDGQFIALPLLKAQCANCGLVQTAQQVEDIFSQLSYRDNYAFYDRPDMKVHDAGLYHRYAEWVARGLPESANLRVLEVGCGAAWVLQNLRSIRPEISVHGIEPSASATRAAIEADIDVIQAAANDPGLDGMHGQFDFVYSINVIEHTPDPVNFLRAMARFANQEGTVCVICPLGDVVNMELLFLDHLYAIRRANLHHMFEIAGLEPVEWHRAPSGFTALQQMTGRSSVGNASFISYRCPAALLDARDKHMREWNAIDGRLLDRLKDHNEVLCFGAGETSDVMRTLAPRTWEKVVGHVVDPVASRLRNAAYRDRPLYYLDDPQLNRSQAVLLGVKPHYQKALYPRLRENFGCVVRWDDLVEDLVEVAA